MKELNEAIRKVLLDEELLMEANAQDLWMKFLRVMYKNGYIIKQHDKLNELAFRKASDSRNAVTNDVYFKVPMDRELKRLGFK